MINLTFQEISNKLKPLIAAHESVSIVYVFGSQVTGSTHPESDLDLAIYFDEPDPVKRADLLFNLSGQISKILKTDKIDAHSLNDLQSPELKYRIIVSGRVIFEREPFRLLVEPRILNEYFDFIYLLRKYNLTRQ